MPHKLSIIDKQTVPDLLWNEFPANPFNEEAIGQIKDNVGNREIPVTSIPSPFAQMHLFETAFKFINEEYEREKKLGNDPVLTLDRNTTYHKVVSQCLDLFELLYSYKVLGLEQKIRIKEWLANVLEDLASASNRGMSTFAKTLAAYINNYNSDKVRFKDLKPFGKLILIYYEDKVIGGTSPFTGFFAMPGELPKDIVKHDSTLFFDQNIPFYKRDLGFQKYLNWLFETTSHAPTAFKSLHEYIRNCREHIKDIEVKRLCLKYANSPDAVLDIERPLFDLLNIDNEPVNLLGNTFQYGYKPVGDYQVELRQSDYCVNTSRIGKKLDNPPILLLRDSKKDNWKYYKGPMPKDIDPDSLLSIPINRRKIPIYNLEYPCLGINDLLSRNIIEFPDYNINKDCFFSIHDEGCRNVLLPIMPTFFDYFTLDDLKKCLAIKRLPASKSIQVTLTLPVKGDSGAGRIQYERVYSHVSDPENLNGEAKGAILSVRMGIGIYPFFRAANNRYNDFYKIAQFYGSDLNGMKCEFYRQSDSQPSTIQISANREFRRTQSQDGLTYITQYSELATFSGLSNATTISGTTNDIRFDFISVRIFNDNISAGGIVVPLWGNEIILNEKGALAFDIGTSNSHVAYAVGDANPSSLNTMKDHSSAPRPVLTFLHEPVDDMRISSRFDFNEKNIQDFNPPQLAEFLPSVISTESYYSFPIRSIINEDNDTVSSELTSLAPLININIPFAFNIQAMRNKQDRTFSHLKWGISDPSKIEHKNRLRMFIDQLALIGRNKLIQEGADPSKADVIWFKPLSMGEAQVTAFKGIWKDIYAKYFSLDGSSEERLHCITESWAPYFSYQSAFGQGKMYMNLDIGGGTSDLLAFRNGMPELTSSFRFAGDNLYEDGLSTTQSKDNGILLKYKQIADNYFRKEKSQFKTEIVEYIFSQPNLRSADLMMFLLTQKEIVESLKLDHDIALIFLLHNASLFYHSAQLLKMKGCEIPEKIGISGNGAKLLEITNRDTDMGRSNGLRKLVELVFQKIYNIQQKPSIELTVMTNPKNATAEGGIKGLKPILKDRDADMNVYHYSLGDKGTLIDANNGQERASHLYADLLKDGDPRLEKIVENVQEFLEFFFDKLWLDCNFVSSYGVNKSLSREKIKNYCLDSKKISSALRTAIQLKRDFEKEVEVNETMFFYPIRAYLYDLSKLLTDSTELSKLMS